MLWKRGEIYISNVKSPITYIFVNIIYIFVVVQIIFLSSANPICRGTDISKYFRETLGIRDNESRLYVRPAKTQINLRVRAV